MGERLAKEEELDRLANLSHDEVLAEVQEIENRQRRAQIIRAIRLRREKWKHLAKAKVAEQKLHDNAPGVEAGGEAEGETTKTKHKATVDAKNASVGDARTKSTEKKEGDVTEGHESTVKGSAGTSGVGGGYERSRGTHVGGEK